MARRTRTRQDPSTRVLAHAHEHDTAQADPLAALRRLPLPPARGWREPGSGRASHVGSSAIWQGTTKQLAGLFPFVGGAGVDVRGVPIGHDAHTHEPIGFHPGQWLRDGLISNTGIWGPMAQPGVGKSAFAKRLALGLSAMGWQIFIPADLKSEYTGLVRALGGTVLRLQRGHDKINPLDPGPLADASFGTDPAHLDTIRARQVAVLEGLLIISLRRPVSATESLLLTSAVGIAAAAAVRGEPTIPEVHAVLSNPTAEILAELRIDSTERYHDLFRELISALGTTVHGALRGLFDARSSARADPATPAISLDIAALDGEADETVAAAMLCSWSWGAGLVEAQQLRGRDGRSRANLLWIQDEMWRALRTGQGLVEKSDRMTRLNRAQGVASLYLTHSMRDLEALPTDEDRAKARGIAARCQVHIYGGMPRPEAELLPVNLTGPEIAELTSWQSSGTYHRGQPHPGRGRYLLKAGERVGLPVVTSLHPEEAALYNTDTAWQDTAWSSRDG